MSIQLNLKNILCLFTSYLFLALPLARSQSENSLIIDQTIAIVGNKMIKYSDIEAQVEGMKMQGILVSNDEKCKILEQLIISNLYELQAEEDSVQISDSEVEGQLDARLRYFIEQIGSKEKLEAFYQKSIIEIKEEYRELIRSKILGQTMERKITEEVRVTPSEVKRYFNSLDNDSIPLIPTEYEAGVIVKQPIISKLEMNAAKERLQSFRERILKGESFTSLAAMYSDDPGSRRKGGDLGFGSRGDWASDFESMAFSLPVGELSPIFETTFGFHILEVLDRKGDQVHVRHLLIRPQFSMDDVITTKKELDSVASLIRSGVYSFSEAVKLFSDEAGRQADGVYLSPLTRKPRFKSDEIEPTVFFTIESLKEGEVSDVTEYMDDNGKAAYRLFYLQKKIPPHKANLKEDYDKIYEMALSHAKQEKMKSWMKNRLSQTYIRLMGPYKDCVFSYNQK